MSATINRLVKRAANAGVARLARSERGRRQLEQLIVHSQSQLGIGTGGTVATSGEQAAFKPLLHNRDTSVPLCIFDVGANHGQFLDLTGRMLRDIPHRVHCFEPSPTTFKILLQNCGQQSNVVFNAFGFGKETGTFDLFSDVEGSGLASLSNRQLDYMGVSFDRRERVEIRTLDSYCQENNISHIDLLKLDVEGHELDVLLGASRMFSEHRIGSVTFEFGGCNIDSRTFFKDFFYFFTAQGMSSVFRILPSGDLDRIDAYSESLEQFRTTNFLVLRNGM